MSERGVLVHEWLAATGGSENVFDAMVATFPEADLLCLWSDIPERYPGRELKETWLAHSCLRRNKAAALPFLLPTWRNQRGRYDWALVSSHLFAHHVHFDAPSGDFRKYVYVHSPARYIWNPELDTRGRGLPRLIAPPLRRLDRRRAQEAVSLAANSAYVRDRIRFAWHRDADVIHPPVDVARIWRGAPWSARLSGPEAAVLEGLPAVFILGASRFVRYKRLDLVIRTGEAAGVPVVIAGAGPMETKLRALAQQATVPVTIVLAPSDGLLYALYEAALAFVFPAVEDFGIMPVEAMATGTPVVVGDVGGARESVVDGVTGVVVPALQPREMARAVEQCDSMRAEDSSRHAGEFAAPVFAARLQEWVHEGIPGAPRSA